MHLVIINVHIVLLASKHRYPIFFRLVEHRRVVVLVPFLRSIVLLIIAPYILDLMKSERVIALSALMPHMRFLARPSLFEFVLGGEWLVIILVIVVVEWLILINSVVRLVEMFVLNSNILLQIGIPLELYSVLVSPTTLKRIIVALQLMPLPLTGVVCDFKFCPLSITTFSSGR